MRKVVTVKVEVGVSIKLGGYEFVMTSIAYPEQYDVFKDKVQVGYVRLRGGVLRCHLGDCTGEIVYEWRFASGKNCFANDKERRFFLRDIVRELDEHQTVEITVECVNGAINLKGTESEVLKVYKWLGILGNGEVMNNIMVDESETFSFCYGDKNDGEYIIDSDGNYIHWQPARCFGIIDIEPLEDGGYVWRNFADFDVEAEYIMDYDCNEYNL